ncbi:4-hydroxy-3-methylbut-2-enyl diphosphate reductase [Enterococcus caccae]|uniref:4-hydroxy-3-methylbut-2-enyl diphosphate reductase n=1 Tax=Enterococcus caccae ATCC BAA-1240 TaxID=1158612 RepID=R3WR94_9ENTE|nr:4-hydroxy-3-methylbut-2-enyl diphosphate reductase [Enterococcus caccae]EOL44350.1 4-hydroxy-3-methylbut-2-enyl diphosphate reductase [Enterococcus caccae ATCC BAA-1240]EOT68534.1 4-hydroxy-3-methylbut-2-enyl diphosphate reductase [Enterococcus caccae ATCC BAA-1240]OJG28251.1 4-hydroxy-3-methylbut-2-enyl diphosphate reductase [Enterococcus caccae]
MEIVNISPRGYCYGVIDAMVIARNASLDEDLPRPIYILGMIVHNKHVTDAFESIGIHTLDGENREEILTKVTQGTVIFTAHGTSPKVKQLAVEKGLTVIDATCPDVMITHELIEKKVAEGYEIIYIGKKNHPEPEGAFGVSPEHVHLVANQVDIADLKLIADKIFVTNQTTMSQWDVGELMDSIQKKYPNVLIHKDICKATQVRQEAVVEQAEGCDLTLVVGDPKSNNSNRLAQVSIEQAKVPAYRISDVSEIDPSWLDGVEKIAVTAGASTPTQIVREVLDYLKQFDLNNSETHKMDSKTTSDAILPRPRIKDLTKNRQRRLEELRSGKR